jgi:hypothetical protein
VKRELESQQSQQGRSNLSRKRIAGLRENVLSPKKVNGVVVRRDAAGTPEAIKIEGKPIKWKVSGKENEDSDPILTRGERGSSRKEALKAEEAAELMQGIDWDAEEEIDVDPTPNEEVSFSRLHIAEFTQTTPNR